MEMRKSASLRSRQQSLLFQEESWSMEEEKRALMGRTSAPACAVRREGGRKVDTLLSTVIE